MPSQGTGALARRRRRCELRKRVSRQKREPKKVGIKPPLQKAENQRERVTGWQDMAQAKGLSLLAFTLNLVVSYYGCAEAGMLRFPQYRTIWGWSERTLFERTNRIARACPTHARSNARDQL